MQSSTPYIDLAREEDASRPSKKARTTQSPPPSTAQANAAYAGEAAVKWNPNYGTPEEQIQRFRDWVKGGAKHEDKCAICGSVNDTLVPCHTCRLSFHRVCVPASAHPYEDDEGWYCSVCVDRNWHVAPPLLSPPPSPRLEPVQQTPVQASPGAPVYKDERSLGSWRPQNVAQPPTQSPAPDSRTATFSTVSFPQQSQPPPQPQTQPQSRTANRKAGRSRYSTLHPEIESAISIIYRELELSRTLSEDVSRLQNQLRITQQELEIVKNQLAAMRREAEMSRSNVAEELNRLRHENQSYKQSGQSADSLQQRNERLIAELNAAREEIVRKDATVEEWKKKLRGFLED